MSTGRSITFAAILTAMLGASPSEAAYTVNLKSGAIPSDITVKNETGLLPATSGYKRGWTRDGWTVDRYGSRGYVLVSPTFTGKAEASRNSLTLPELEINDGDFLQWEGMSVHPDRKENYVVEATGSNGKINLLEVTGENAEWTNHMVDLSEYAGQKLTIAFICESENRYLLALDNIQVGAPEGIALITTNLTEVYCDAAAAEAGYTDYTVEIKNTGATLTGGEISLDANYEAAGSTEIDTPWKPGETRTLKFQAPVTMNRRTTCELYYSDGTDRTQLDEKTLYCSTFKRRLLVDKGTGMWCVNCPDGTLAIEEVERQFGKSLVLAESHNNDILKNEALISGLGFRTLPHMILNRIKTSASSNADLFFNFYYRPVKFDINFTAADTEDNEQAKVTVAVRCAEETDNTSGRYRVGYMLTGDFHKEEEDPFWYQKNGCTQPAQERFYFMASMIISPLAYFHHVTLTSDHALDGFEGSLPASMTPGANYGFSWDIERPALLENIKNGRVVAYVLDTESGEILNCAELELLNPDFSGIEETVADNAGNGVSLTAGADGKVTVNLPDSSDFTLEAWTLDGRKAASVNGYASNSAVVTLPVAHGVYMLRLVSECGTATCKTIL